MVVLSGFLFHSQREIASLKVEQLDEMRQLNKTSRTYATKLKREGWHWIDGKWKNRQQNANTLSNPTI